jgi:hypothetical protein
LLPEHIDQRAVDWLFQRHAWVIFHISLIGVEVYLRDGLLWRQGGAHAAAARRCHAPW